MANPRQTIGNVFKSIVRSNGGRVAIVDGHKELSYSNVDALSDCVSRWIAANVERSPSAIALMTRDPSYMLVCLIGVLKSGMYYVPIDPNLPDDQIRDRLVESNPVLVASDPDETNRINRLTLKTTRTKTPIELIEEASESEPRDGFRPCENSLAYILYTSGSTGAAKAAEQRHVSVLHNVVRHAPLGITRSDRVLLITQNGFFAAISNVYIAFLTGATIVHHSIWRDGSQNIANTLREQRVTVFYSFTTLLREAMRNSQSMVTSSALRMIYVGGEPVYWSDYDTAIKLFGKETRFWTGLNSTETGLTLLNEVKPESPRSSPAIPLGNPVKDINVTLSGEASDTYREIIVSSPYLMNGYHKNPIATARVLSKQHKRQHLTNYRSGDLASYSSDGKVVYYGRKDFMVKVRGRKVHLSQVEAAIASRNWFEDAVVVTTGVDEPKILVVGTRRS